jgi:hypothetical protein
VRGEAEVGLLDEDQVQAELLSLSMQHAAGDISDIEYEEYETELLDILDAMRIYRESMLESEPWDDDR